MKRSNRIKLLALCAILILVGIICTFLPNKGDAASGKKVSDSLLAMDTYMSFTAYGENAPTAIDQAKSLVLECEKNWSVTDPESEISHLNAEGRRTLTAVTAELLETARRYALLTNGYFDPTIYPLVKAWGFTNGEYRVPENAEIEALKQLVGIGKLSLEGAEALLADGSMIDLGGIAKGFAGDLIMDVFRGNGIKSAIINLGGNVQTLGLKPDSSRWTIGIRSPYSSDLIGKVSVGEGCVITSGAYERHFTAEDGTLYGHILSPFTGRPADKGIVSVTVLCKKGSMGDALSTALFAMGTEEAIAFWRANGSFDVILLSDDGTLFVSEGVYPSFSPIENDEIKTVCEIKRSS